MEILVVDDELAIRKGLAAMLEESGYSVRTARGGLRNDYAPHLQGLANAVRNPSAGLFDGLIQGLLSAIQKACRPLWVSR